MRFIPRSTDISTLATSLSLAVANYKPIPQLPTEQQLISLGYGSSHGLSTMVNGNANATTATNTTTSNSTSSFASSLRLPAGQSFKVQPSSSSSSPSADLSHGASLKSNTTTSTASTSSWGEPSLLFIAQDDNSTDSSTSDDGARVLASSSTVGPGNCPIQKAYTPVGGWDALPDPTFAPFDPVKATAYRYRQQVGVNLGAWFVQEQWMEPSLYACAASPGQAEIDILNGFGSSKNGVGNATAWMEKHWDTWIDEDDFKQMAAKGINTVRIPIGHFSVGPYFTRQSAFSDYANVYYYSWRYIARAINWAAKYDMGVLIDMHAAFGAQNDQAHSGLSGGNVGFFSQTNRDLTADVLVWLANEISDVTNIVGIQLLNEPQNRDALWTWYNQTMDQMRKASPYAATVPLYFHDAFDISKGADFVSQRSDFVVQDNHAYYVFTSQDTSTSAAKHTSQIESSVKSNFATQSTTARRNMVVGEWSCALSPSSLTGVSDQDSATHEYCEAQRATYAETTAGYMFWSWKMENCDNNAGWCFKGATKNNRYLDNSFNTWGLSSKISSQIVKIFNAALTGSSSSDKTSSASTTLLAAINNITLSLPAAIAAPVSLKVNSTASSTTTAPKNLSPLLSGDLLGSISSPKTEVAAPAAEEGHGRVGMVTSNSSSQKSFAVRSSSGSFAARAASIARRDIEKHEALQKRLAITTMLASQVGYSDGFRTAQILAGSANLSRLGFAPQYIADSWAARFTAHPDLFVSGNVKSYSKNFKTGVLDAEASIALLVKKAT